MFHGKILVARKILEDICSPPSLFFSLFFFFFLYDSSGFSFFISASLGFWVSLVSF
jgi:hypothetical protein